MRRCRPSTKPNRRLQSISSGRVTLPPGFVRSSPARRPGSVFREIEARYARRRLTDFDGRLAAALAEPVPRWEARLRREIAAEARHVDDVLAGRREPEPGGRKRPCRDDDKENGFQVKVAHVPPAGWVFQTPPNRKLDFQAVQEPGGLRPALLDGRTVYEVKGRVDLAAFPEGQQVQIDKRFLVEAGAEEDKVESYELENHFLSLTCRPKKATCALSRLANVKRKRDIFEPEAGCSSEPETGNEFESSFTFINSTLNNLEESFTLKFTANEGATTGHLFDFDGNKKDSFNFRF